MRNRLIHRFTAIALGALIGFPIATLAADWYVASGKPVQRSLLNSGDLRTEFANIQSDIADKLPALTGNGGRVVAVNSGGTALEAITNSTLLAALGLTIGTDVQAYDADLTALAGLSSADSNFIVGSASGWVVESGATAQASLGLGSLAALSTVGSSQITDASVATADLANDAVSNAKLANMGQTTVKGRASGAGTGDPTDLTAAQLIDILETADGSGTGLDADTVDGSHASAFASASHNHSAADITSGTLSVTRGGTGQTTMDNVSEQVVLQWTIQNDPGGTPSGSPGDVFAYY